MTSEHGEVKDWAEFEKRFDFEQTVYDLVRKAIPAVAGAFPDEKPFVAFAFNCASAWGYLSISVGSSPNCANDDPPEWEHECIEQDIPEMLAAWRAVYEPLQERYRAASDRFCDEHGIDA